MRSVQESSTRRCYATSRTRCPTPPPRGRNTAMRSRWDAWARRRNALAPLVRGLTLEQITADMGRFWRRLTGDSQLRWVGPEKGVLHLATAAIVNAVWDLYAKAERKPLWQLLAGMSPEELVRCIDFRYITDALTPQEAIDI